MTIQTLSIQHLRNLAEVSQQFNPHFNLILGDNGAGKTSLLEAIHLLSCGKSFRSSQLPNVIKHNHTSYTLYAQVIHNASTVKLGQQRDQNGKKQLKIDGMSQHSFAEFAKHLPLQLITTSSYRFFHESAKQRMQWVDWGVFHVKPKFITYWRQYQSTLRQRNASLKQKQARARVQAWDSPLIELSNKIDELRNEYISEIHPHIETLFEKMLNEIERIEINYLPGWNREKGIAQTLDESYERDSYAGYTTAGAHRADVIVQANGQPAKDYLSQGQQKIAIYSMKIAQGKHLREQENKAVIYLIDDLPSELDENKQQYICELLEATKAQVFITAIEASGALDRLNKEKTNRYTMNSGCLTPLICG